MLITFYRLLRYARNDGPRNDGPRNDGPGNFCRVQRVLSIKY